MPNLARVAFLAELAKRFGPTKKLSNSESLFEIGEGKVRLYYRYSKKHPDNRTFFGLRKVDLQAIDGHDGIMCFCWGGQREPLFVPFREFEDVFASLNPASDGQYKAQVYEQDGGTELYIANAGRFNVESYMGWASLESLVHISQIEFPVLSHAQIQTLLGGIGAVKGFDIWIPPADRSRVDWALTPAFHFANSLPPMLSGLREIAEEIDVIWLNRGGDRPEAFYEVEHSTPIYSGLLRFNDVHLSFPGINLRFGIVSNDERRSLFVRQLARPTFQASRLAEICTFFDYRNVFGWHQRLRQGERNHASQRTQKGLGSR
jgi:hypothetical protein